MVRFGLHGGAEFYASFACSLRALRPSICAEVVFSSHARTRPGSLSLVFGDIFIFGAAVGPSHGSVVDKPVENLLIMVDKICIRLRASLDLLLITCFDASRRWRIVGQI